MTRQQYQNMTEKTRGVMDRLPCGAWILNLPASLCGLLYLAILGWLAWNRDGRIIRAALVPAVSFCVVTVLRPLIHRQRPFDRFGIPPVGSYKPGRGKSMPSRHTVSAAAIAIAVVYIFPNPAVIIFMTLLTVLIAALRVLSGQHYPSDVAAALALAILISTVGYTI